MVLMKSRSLFVESNMSSVFGYDPETKLFHNFSYNENPTRAITLPHSNAVCHQLMLLTGEEKNSLMCIKVHGHLVQVCFIEIHQVFAKKKTGWILF